MSDTPRRLPERRALVLGAGALAFLLLLALAAPRIRDSFRWESTDDAQVEGHMVYVSAQVAGRVVEVTVEENRPVHAGDVLVRLDPADYEAQVARARADLDAARNHVRAARASAESAQADAQTAAAELWKSGQEAMRVQRLFERGVASRHELDQAIAARQAAEARVRSARMRGEAELAATGSDAPVRQAEAALKTAELALSYTTIRAPFDAVVGRKSVEVGAYVAPGQALLALTQDGATWVVANFKETQIARMRAGAAAELRVDAYPGVVWRGHVESLAPATGARYALLPPDNATGNFTKVVQRVPVRIVLDGPAEGRTGDSLAPDDLPVGLSVEARVAVR